MAKHSGCTSVVGMLVAALVGLLVFCGGVVLFIDAMGFPLPPLIHSEPTYKKNRSDPDGPPRRGRPPSPKQRDNPEDGDAP